MVAKCSTHILSDTHTSLSLSLSLSLSHTHTCHRHIHTHLLLLTAQSVWSNTHTAFSLQPKVSGVTHTPPSPYSPKSLEEHTHPPLPTSHTHTVTRRHSCAWLLRR